MTWLQTAILFAILAGAGFEGIRIALNLYLVGRPFRVWRIERLDHPVPVVGLESGSLVLHDGRRIDVPGLERYRGKGLLGLRQFWERGVEITPDGRILGLVEIHHWCGNDPVAREIVRVDLGKALAYLVQGGLYRKVCKEDPTLDVCDGYTGRFSSTGRLAGEYWDFKEWRDHAR